MNKYKYIYIYMLTTDTTKLETKQKVYDASSVLP